MSVVCCCALAGTRACLTCPNNMTAEYRYPPPYVAVWTDTTSAPTESGLQEEALRRKFHSAASRELRPVGDPWIQPELPFSPVTTTASRARYYL